MAKVEATTRFRRAPVARLVVSSAHDLHRLVEPGTRRALSFVALHLNNAVKMCTLQVHIAALLLA